MEFIANNYVWFIVIGVIAAMAVIGYFADKTDFGRKFKVEKPVKTEKPVKAEKNAKTENKKIKKDKEQKVTKIEIDAKGIDELSKEVADKNFSNDNEFQKNDSVNTEDNLDQVLSQTSFETQNIPTPTANETVDQSLFAPLSDQSSNVSNSTNIDSVLTTEENSNTVNEVVSDDLEKQPEELKNIEPVNLSDSKDDNKNGEKVAEEEDIWKF